jgi:hypothetical protein
VPGGRDWEEFRYAVDDAEEDRLVYIQPRTPRFLVCQKGGGRPYDEPGH